MLGPLITLAGSAAGGAILGLISDTLNQRSKDKVELERIRFGREQKLHKYQVSLAGTHPPFYSVIMLLAATYCLCTLICFLCGDVPVATQSFGAEPTKLELGFGLFKRSESDKTVYLLTFAGLGTYFLSPIAFILTSVLTGIVPKRGV